MNTIRNDAEKIMKSCLKSAQPDTAVQSVLSHLPAYKGHLYVVALGKAAWQMSSATVKILGDSIDQGICITKYDHVKSQLEHFTCYEAGHPVPDENSFRATRAAEGLVHGLGSDDLVILLISGGGSALFEDPAVDPEDLQQLTRQLLACGADITEINTIRKHLSHVKGGRFALQCAPARVVAIILSDIIGDPLDMIASGPAYPDSTTSEDALHILQKYDIHVSDSVRAELEKETPKQLDNVETHVTGSVRQLCAAATKEAVSLGYEPVYLTSSLSCEAREAGSFLASIARDHRADHKKLAYIAGGETVVHLTGKGLGGRNQEIALSAARGIRGLEDTLVFSLGSDGTDGPTDAAGGIVDGTTADRLQQMNISIDDVLRENDAYHALQKVDGLIMTGPTGTNVNDISVLLLG